MNLSDLVHHIGPRPKSGRCMRCGKRFAIKPVGRIRYYCSPACRQSVFDKVTRLTRPKGSRSMSAPRYGFGRRWWMPS